MKLRLWCGYHSAELLTALGETWKGSSELLIACPPALDGSDPSHFDFVKHLPFERVEFIGQWPKALVSLPALSQSTSSARATFGSNDRPVIGVFTSGTLSGKPRLVLYSRKNIESSLEGIFSLFDLKRIDTVFCYAQPFHTFGLLLGYMFSILFERELRTPTEKYDRSAHDSRLALTSSNVITLGTPTHFYDLISRANSSGRPPASYTSITGGASVSREMWRKLQRELSIEAPSIGYGCTEASPGIAHLPPGVEPQEDSEVGFALPAAGAKLSEGGVEISGPATCVAIVDQNGWQKMRSLVIRDRLRARPDGAWVYEGRLDLQLNRGGEKFSLENIEAALLQSLGLHAVCVATPDERLGEDLGIFVQGTGDLVTSKIEGLLQEKFRLRINPARVRFGPSIPLTSNHKIDRRQVRELVLA